MADSLSDAIVQFRKRRWGAALRLFLEADSDSESAQLIAYYLGLCYARLNEHDKAILYLEQVVSSDFDPVRAYQCRMALAYLYAISGKPELADLELGRLLKNGYESPQIFAAKGYAAFKMGNQDRAIELYRRALDSDPDNPTILNSLGFILADTGRDLTQGLLYVKRALEKNQGNPAYLDSLGWVYFKMRSYKEARTWLSRALSADPSNTEIRTHLEALGLEA